jgi:hypothetical protein
MVLFLAAAMLSHIWLFLRPSEFLPVFITFSLVLHSNSSLALQGLVHRGFGKSGDIVMQKSLRVFAVSETIGYAVGVSIHHSPLLSYTSTGGINDSSNSVPVVRHEKQFINNNKWSVTAYPIEP